MNRFKFFIFVTSLPQFVITDSPCAPKSSLSSQIRVSSQNQIEIRTILQTLLRKDDTACFELRLTSNDNNNNITRPKSSTTDHLLLKISLEDIWQEYEVKKDYNFTTPALDVRCLCDCPGGADKCNKDYESEYNCNEHQSRSGFCFRYYSYGHSSSGCFFPFDSAEVCCSVSIFKASSDVYHAFYLASPKIYYKLKTILMDYKGEVLNVSSCVVSPENGPSVPGNSGCNFQIETSGHTGTNLPNSFWTYRDPRSSKFMVNRNMNDVYETNLKKLGWFKVLQDPNDLFQIGPGDARSAFQIYMENCVNDVYKWTFDAVGYLKPQTSSGVKLDDREFGEPIEEFYKSTINKVIKKYRSLIVHPRATAPIGIHATLNFPADVVIFQTMGRFDNFRSSINFDKFGNKMLEVEIFNAFGTLYLSVGGNKNCSSDTFSFTVTRNLEKWTETFKMSHCFIGEQSVCVYTFDRKMTKCSVARYTEEYFILNGRTLQPPVDGEKLSTTQSGYWLASIGNWFTNLFSDVKSALVIIGMALFIGIIFCLLRGPVVQLFLCIYKNSSRTKKDSNSVP